MDIVCINGEFVPHEKAEIPASDAGLLLGEGVFETMRAEQGQILNAREHFKRLARGVRVMEIPFQVEPEELLALCEQTLDANGLKEARVRLTLTRGPMRGHPASPGEGIPTLLITAVEFDQRLAEDRERGWSVVSSEIPVNHLSPLATIKATCYAEKTLARRAARREGCEEAILYNIDGRLAEASMANVFIVRGDRLMTPPVEEGALPGTFREHLIRIAADRGIAVQQVPIEDEEIDNATEIFLTNSVIEIMPVVKFDDEIVGTGAPGSMTRMLFQAHRLDVERALRSVKD